MLDRADFGWVRVNLLVGVFDQCVVCPGSLPKSGCGLGAEVWYDVDCCLLVQDAEILVGIIVPLVVLDVW